MKARIGTCKMLKLTRQHRRECCLQNKSPSSTRVRMRGWLQGLPYPELPEGESLPTASTIITWIRNRRATDAGVDNLAAAAE